MPFMMAKTRVIDTGSYDEAKLRVRTELERRGLTRFSI